MASVHGETKVIAVSEGEPLSDQEVKDIYAKNNDGIVSCEFVKHEDLDDDTLEMLFEQSPEWVMEHRPDWIKANKKLNVN